MSAPSFSSFPPSFTSFPDLEPPVDTKTGEDKEKAKKREKSRKHKREHDRDEDSEYDKKRRRRPDIEDEELRRDKSKKPKARGRERDREEKYTRPSRAPTDVTYEDAYSLLGGKSVYFTDSRGDALNITYGGLHAGDVPRYYPVARGRKVLGLPALNVVHRGFRSITLDIGGFRRSRELTDPRARHLLQAPPERRLLPSDKYKHEEVDGFLRITTRKPRTGDPSYRAITVSKHPSDSEETTSTSEDEGAESTDYDSDTTPETSLQATLRSLEERLTSYPDSISTWLSLLAHTLSTVPTTSKNAVRARSEISVSVLSRALKAHPDNTRSKSLRLRYLQAGEEIWNEQQIHNEWEEALKVGGRDIWIEWLDWRIRAVEKDLDGILQSVKRAYAAFGKDEVAKLRIFWRVAVAFRDAGYTERAMAAFQAQAELMYQLPANLRGQPEDVTLDALEEFWEAEVPRTGEAGANGWAAWVNAEKPEIAPPSRPKKARHDISHMDPYVRWAAQELRNDRDRILPARSTDEEESDDPYATILFSDIRPLLFSLASASSRHAFRSIWLCFLGLNIPGFLNSLSEAPAECSDDRWASRHLSCPAYLHAIFPRPESTRRLIADSQAGVLVGREPEYESIFGPVKSCGYDVLKPLDVIGKAENTVWAKEDVEGVDEEVVREVFRMCKFQQDETEWDRLALAFETAVNAKSAVKKSRAALAKVPDSLPRWATHARIERLRGRFDEARKIYHTILSSITHPSAHPGIWWDWAELEWLSGNTDAAMQVVLRSMGITGSGGVAVLRAKRGLDDLISGISPEKWRERETWIKLRALLELLSSSARNAISYLDSIVQSIEPESTAHESLTTGSLLFIYYDTVVLKDPIPPVLLRERAERAIEHYPNNTIILGLFLEAQKGQGVWGRMRALLSEQIVTEVEKEKDVARRVAEVWVAKWEKGRWEAELERTRNGLSNAVQHERTRGSPTLWRIYLEFETRYGQLQRAKKLLFRAIGECPLVKELYLLAFGPLRSVFSARELNDMAETMAERGIRMRTGLDEELGGWKETGSESGDEKNEAIEDEIEYNAEELRRLRPY